ncbi:hypothetical protein [Winogradskyella luteola]|uniref:Lipocalin-like domain-containing protein n=1 Tax=Winogradskyella luteola TaxID=2828330 RepID=A0A9X1F8N0_9FLAO|nr:hypothetical protein [Winogradskyella luteola]MBV7268633.1 hypothetical protein [Winogradskyella luteola]
MKKIFLNLFVLLGLLLVTSCSDDDDDNSVSLEGTWVLTTLSTDGSFDLNNDGSASANLLNEINCPTNESIIFTDVTATYVSTFSLEEIELVVDGEGETEDMYIVDCDSGLESNQATYVRNGNTITVTFTYVEDGETFEEINILNIDGNTITFTEVNGFVVEGDDFEILVQQDLVYTFTKE